MAVRIGASSHGFSNPTGFLSDCHRRIEMFLGALEAVAKALDRPLAEGERKSLDAALRYFRESAPKHNADEEESLFPRLRRIRDPQAQQAVEKLETLEREHRWAEPLHAEIDRLGQICLSGRELSAEAVRNFREAVSQLGAMYRTHIAAEENVVFHAASLVLSAADQAAIAKEMEARRSLNKSD